MTNNYPEWEPGGRGGVVGVPPPAGSPGWQEGRGWASPGPWGGGKNPQVWERFSENVRCRLSPNVRNTNGK